MSEVVASKTPYALEMRGVSKRFPGTLAVNNVDFKVRPGEVHALLGENGAGKSTLMKVLAGLYGDYTGDIFINGEKRLLHTPNMAKEAGIGMIYQELSLARRISVYENLLVGRLPKKNALFIDKKKAIREARELLSRVGLEDLDPTLDVSEISQCDAQLVEIAKALGSEPRILVMDEPTSALSSEEVQRLFAIIRNLQAQGLAIVYISHHLSEIFEIADAVTVLRDGERVDSLPMSQVTTESLVEKMVGKPVSSFYGSHGDQHIGEEVLRVEDFTRWGFFHHVNFSLHRGEVLVICGLAGSGRTEIAQALVGIDKVHRGKLFLKGKEVQLKDFGEAIRNGLGYLSESRATYGLALPQSVTDNVLSCVIDKYANGILFSAGKQLPLVQEKIDGMQVYPADPQRQVNSFSGGNQQKVLMAKWLAADVDILILDQPTRGVDVGAKQIIHEAVHDFVKTGRSVILLSSDLPEVVALSDRAVVLREGHIIGEIPREGITEHSLLMAANGEGEYVQCPGK